MITSTHINKGFTLIELIMVTIILGILAAVAIPRYVATVERAEASAEDAVISIIKAGLETYATEKYMEHGRREWPADPFDALEIPVIGHTDDTGDADVDGEWTFNSTSSMVTHMRGDNSVLTWDYSQGNTTSGLEEVGTFDGLRNSAPVYVDHDWCGSYCYDLNQYGSFENIPSGWWPPEYAGEECDCSVYGY